MEAIIDLLFAITSSLIYVLWTTIYIGFIVTAFSPLFKIFDKENIKPLFPIFFKEMKWYHLIICSLLISFIYYKYFFLLEQTKNLQIITVILFVASMLLSFIKKIFIMIFQRCSFCKTLVYHIHVIVGFTVFGIISILTGLFWFNFF